jgi:hypothetical protein
MRRILICIPLLAVWLLTEVQGQQCTQIGSCDACLRLPLGCKWCSDQAFSGSRCLPITDNATKCNSGFENPTIETEYLESVDFDSSHQIKPQRVSLKIRPGQSATFDLKIKPAPNFPLDLYFLMDFSYSMKNDLNKMKSLALDISEVLNQITENFTLGFGSFVDKPTDPFVNLDLRYRQNPCNGFDHFCSHPFGFHHHISLTNDTFAFQSGVARQRISINLDNPEGGSDGMLQVAVCKDLIGWRPHPARKLLIYITDDHFHFAYDGKLGGAVTPHDGQCHMTKQKTNGKEFYDYHQTTRLDYPSLSMLIDKLQQENIFPVFGVAVLDTDGRVDNNAVYQSYENITQNFPNAIVAPLTKDSSNLLTVIEDAYHTIASRIQLSIVGGDRRNLKIEYESDCGGDDKVFSDLCTGITIGKEVTFRVTVSADECTPDLQNGTSFMIGTGFFGQMEVHVQMECGCKCSAAPEKRSPRCSEAGTLLCGECNCEPGNFGTVCQCGSESNSTTDLSSDCMMVNGQVCSGPEAGECHCGKCICYEERGYYGNACECNRLSCLKNSKNQMCSGHGMCECGECVCDKAPSGRPYTGEICDCYPDDDVCQRTPEEGPCGNHGDCMCGECKCNHGFAGQFCQFCIIGSVCGPKGCKSYEPCVSCLYSIEGNSVVRNTEKNCLEECQNVTLLQRNQSFSFSETLVECLSGDQCSGIKYFVHFESKLVFVEDVPTRCPISPVRVEPWIIAIPLLVGLIILALILLAIIKMILKYLDYREYKQFERDASKIKFPKVQ